MNPATVLALICELYANLAAANRRITELEAELAAAKAESPA